MTKKVNGFLLNDRSQVGGQFELKNSPKHPLVNTYNNCTTKEDFLNTWCSTSIQYFGKVVCIDEIFYEA
jgi:hypothetical protein